MTNNYTTPGRSRDWYWLPRLFCCAVLASGAVIVWCVEGRGQSTREELLGREPLAICKAQLRKAPSEPEQMSANLVNMARVTPEDEALKYYARGHDGQWSIPAEVNRNDPWIRVLVLGPAAPLMIDLAVYVDGTPYRELRERWLDELVAKAIAPPAEVKETEPEKQEPPSTEEETVASTDSEQEETPSGVKVQSRRAPSAEERLRQYLAAGVASTDREEIRWLMAEWAGGPSLLAMSPAVSWRRAEIAPLYSLLDADHDLILSADEIARASKRLQRTDTDGNDIVDLEELKQSEGEYSPYPRSMSHPLVMVLNEQTPWNVLRREIVKLYGGKNIGVPASTGLKGRISRGDGTLTTKQMKGLLQVSPDMTCRVDLNDAGGKVALLAAEGAVADSDTAVSTGKHAIAVDCGGTYVEFSALSMPAGKETQKQQLTVGAVVDGYPLLRLLDQDNNRRLTLRECRQLNDCLAGLDADRNGRIDDREMPTAIRLTIARGLFAHEGLSQPIAATRKIESPNSQAIPPWFADMDRNSDGDLSRREFLGNSEQFDRLDQDRDGLINAKEAQDSPVGGE